MPRKYTLDWYLSIRHEAPKGEIASWAIQKAMPNFFLYKSNGKKKTGRCTACKVEAEHNVIKNRYTNCPSCGQRVKAVEKNGFKYGYDCFVSWLDRYDGFFLNRIFRVFRYLTANDEEVHIEEAQMQVLGMPIKKTYWQGDSFSRETSYKNSNWFTMNGGDRYRYHPEAWERGILGGFGYNIYQAPTYVYPVGLMEILKGTLFEYSSLWELAQNGKPFSIRKALLAYRRVPQLEYLIKLKMYNLARDATRQSVRFCFEENNVIKFLGLNDCNQMQYVIDNDLNGADFDTYRSLVQRNLEVNEQNKRLMKLRGWLGDGVDKIFGIMSAESFLQYYEEQRRKGDTLRLFCHDYVDHIRVVQELGLDIQNTMYSKPKDFYNLHNTLSVELSAMKDKAKYEKVKRALRSEKTYAFSFGDFSLIVPKNANEIVMEGKEQCHCVGSYLDRVASKTSIIVFIRRTEEPGKAFYTMEINPKTMDVVQCRGRNNCAMTSDVRAFVELYKEKVLSKKRRRKAA